MAGSAQKQMTGKILWSGLMAVAFTINMAVAELGASRTVLKQNSPVLHRQKRKWEWNTLSVQEELLRKYLPQKIGKLKNDNFNANTKFIIEGEGANDIFIVNDQGDIFVSKTLDRETKSQYHLTAHILDVLTNSSVEADSKFIVDVLDINDHSPVFQEPLNGSIPERSAAGSTVLIVTATDADDPTSPNARIEYALLNGTDLFSIDEEGVITTKLNNLDREKQSVYYINVKAKDMKDHTAGNTNTTTVIITVTDINDNRATFRKSKYSFDVREDEKPGFKVGTLEVDDLDEVDHKEPIFTIEDMSIKSLFDILPNHHKDGNLNLKQRLNYEEKKSYNFGVMISEDIKVVPDNQGKSLLTKAEVEIRVIDVDEPPEFTKQQYNFSILEGKISNPFIGTVTATDPDKEKHRIRYSIEDPNCPVKVNSGTGQLTLQKELDRELQDVYECQVTAQEDQPNGLKSYATVKLSVLDVNDNKPELSAQDVYVCENDKAGTVIGHINATDKDKHVARFRFSLAKKSENFSLYDNNNNTASIVVKKGEFSTEDPVEILEIEITDGGIPPLKSFSPLYIGVCTCLEGRQREYCKPAYSHAGVSVSALIAILLCILTILVIVILIVMRRRYQKDALVTLGKSSGEIHEQLVTYDEEGGGEMDTNGYDVSILSSACHDGTLLPRPGPAPTLYAVVKKPSACKGDMAMMIEVKKDEADHDRDGIPYDTLHIYGYEGTESLAGSLSSLDTSSSGSNLDYDFLNDWGPRFRTLAQLYGVDGSDSDGLY
ncbi:cadherin-5 [Chanos chanos]|uniref:Cadherin-5 n=1 Tax=Chanos chanos TaxID=29144 RepID=A0A6J2UR83_CHACN|nr:cadherin-5 [Chanos chanos]